MAKGRKKTSDASKRLRGTDQPCRMDGADVPAVIAPASELPADVGGDDADACLGQAVFPLGGLADELRFVPEEIGVMP